MEFTKFVHWLFGAQQSGIPPAETATMVSLAPAMPYSLTVGWGASILQEVHKGWTRWKVKAKNPGQ